MSEISIPFRIGPNGGVVKTSDPDQLARQHLISYIMTTPGERVMRPAFGTEIQASVFEVNNPLFAETLRQDVALAVQRDVPDVSLQTFQVIGSTDQSGTLTINLQYAQKVGPASVNSQPATITVGTP